MEAQPSMEMGVLTFPGVSKQHIRCHRMLWSGNQNDCTDMNDGGAKWGFVHWNVR
jgi:hypothetical protein